MRIKITGRGIYGAEGEIEVGTEFDIKGEPPAAWAGRYEVVKENPAKGAKAVTNKVEPAKGGGDD